MLDNPEESEPLLPGSGEEDTSKKSAQERHELFKKEVDEAQVRI